MPWLIGRKPISPETVGVILEHSCRVPDFERDELSSLIPINHGGVDSDYSLFQISYSDSNMILDGYSYSVNWSNGEIVGIELT